ncbi:hypothetical protein HK100_011869 [Physocladia obscura]|uniref:Uncharacterized protein n=1 Tax=Physocladia obscura TaxID=109957 RepID=A0AAD5T1J8_9FUNG|nr:hypothetical protein HK100_011869 [Physocladia obscura]
MRMENESKKNEKNAQQKRGMSTPAASQAWMTAEPASICTLLPSMNTSTGARMWREVPNARRGVLPIYSFVCLITIVN